MTRVLGDFLRLVNRFQAMHRPQCLALVVLVVVWVIYSLVFLAVLRGRLQWLQRLLH